VTEEVETEPFHVSFFNFSFCVSQPTESQKQAVRKRRVRKD